MAGENEIQPLRMDVHWGFWQTDEDRAESADPQQLSEWASETLKLTTLPCFTYLLCGLEWLAGSLYRDVG